MIQRAPVQPWQPEESRTCVRGRLTLKVRSGEAPSAVPDYLSVARGLGVPRPRLDGGPVDSVLRRHSGALRITRAYNAAANGGERWDEIEDATGLSRTFRIELDPSASLLRVLDELRSLNIVESAGPQYLNTTPFADLDADEPADPLYAHRLVGADQALRFEPGDSTLIVAVVDSGVRARHPELEGRVRPGVDTVDLPPDQVTRGLTIIGDASRPDRDPDDQMGHGTACASIIAARGIRVPRGLAGAVRLLPARALAAARYAQRSALTAVGALPDIDHAVKLAVDLGARVLNLSFGTPESSLREDDPRPHGDVIDYALRRGCVLVAASGNSGDHTRYFPAAYPGVIAVGSVGEGGRPSSFSTRGEHVRLCAPGEHVPSAGLDGYQTNTGTSFAAPYVTAACALLLARAHRYGVPLSPADVARCLGDTAHPFAANTETTGCGAGVLDVMGALQRLESGLLDGTPSRDPFHPQAAPAA